ncbi:MAG: hypothetical protein LQ337_006734 [Flavoplaca oasis]|nr:MAG: hypothetical protein LQ337_006734 [Flavoplaca oasis]
MSVASEASDVTAPEEPVKTLESLDMDIFERMFGGPPASPSAGSPAGPSVGLPSVGPSAGPPGPPVAGPPGPPVAGPPGPASVAPSVTPSGTAAEDVLRDGRQNFLNLLAPGGRVLLPGNYGAPRPVVPAPNVQPPNPALVPIGSMFVHDLVATADVASRLICM